MIFFWHRVFVRFWPPPSPPKRCPRGPKTPPRAPKEAPRGRQERPRRLPESLKRPQPRGPKTSHDLSHLTFSMFPSKSPNFLLCLTYSPNFFIGHLTQELVNRPLQLQRCPAKMPCHRTRTGMPKAGGRAAVSPQRGRQSAARPGGASSACWTDSQMPNPNAKSPNLKALRCIKIPANHQMANL